MLAVLAAIDRLGEQATLADLSIALDLPVILVVGVRLGCINHALLTAEAIARKVNGVKLVKNDIVVRG